MDNSNRDFYDEKKWCGACHNYVRYLMSVNASFCIDCGAPVKLFSTTDSERFAQSLEKRKWKAS